MNSILVIGCVSLDVIHLEQSGRRESYNTIGGAGLFTAMAAARAGAPVTLYSPKPDPMPAALRPVETALNWIGPAVDPDQMPALEIVHHGEGRATLLSARWGPESLLTPKDLLGGPAFAGYGGTTYDIAHIAALSSAARQLEFQSNLAGGRGVENSSAGGRGAENSSAGGRGAENSSAGGRGAENSSAGGRGAENSSACRSWTGNLSADHSGAGKLSAGTYARAITADRASVLELLAKSDYFFMNTNEHAMLCAGNSLSFGETLVFVTDGKNGASLCCAGRSVHIEAVPARELDPTGAGDTFCGATLAGLIGSKSAADSAAMGASLAAKIIEHPGSRFYFAGD